MNVSVIEPRFKHPTIFVRFDELNEGEEFVILNDHDPKPLYYQLLGERGNIFTWEYLEEGPESWLVRIAKRKTTANAETLGEIAAKDLKKAQIFKKYGLDFCCGGNIGCKCRNNNTNHGSSSHNFIIEFSGKLYNIPFGISINNCSGRSNNYSYKSKKCH